MQKYILSLQENPENCYRMCFAYLPAAARKEGASLPRLPAGVRWAVASSNEASKLDPPAALIDGDLSLSARYTLRGQERAPQTRRG